MATTNVPLGVRADAECCTPKTGGIAVSVGDVT